MQKREDSNNIRLDFSIHDGKSMKNFSVFVPKNSSLFEATMSLPIEIKLAIHEELGLWIKGINGIYENKEGFGWQFYIADEKDRTCLPYVATESGLPKFVRLDNIKVAKSMSIVLKYERFLEELKMGGCAGEIMKADEKIYTSAYELFYAGPSEEKIDIPSYVYAYNRTSLGSSDYSKIKFNPENFASSGKQISEISEQEKFSKGASLQYLRGIKTDGANKTGATSTKHDSEIKMKPANIMQNTLNQGTKGMEQKLGIANIYFSQTTTSDRIKEIIRIPKKIRKMIQSSLSHPAPKIVAKVTKFSSRYSSLFKEYYNTAIAGTSKIKRVFNEANFMLTKSIVELRSKINATMNSIAKSLIKYSKTSKAIESIKMLNKNISEKLVQITNFTISIIPDALFEMIDIKMIFGFFASFGIKIKKGMNLILSGKLSNYFAIPAIRGHIGYGVLILIFAIFAFAYLALGKSAI